MMEIFLFYPPVGRYQRGEMRCQANIANSATMAHRFPLDIAVLASQARQSGMLPYVRDYPAHGGCLDDLVRDLDRFNFDVAYTTTTFPTIEEDFKILRIIKQAKPHVITVAGGLPFVKPSAKTLDILNSSPLDYAFSGEPEAVFPGLMKVMRRETAPGNVPGLFFKVSNADGWHTSAPAFLSAPLDDLPFSARDLTDNSLYKRPDTGEIITTIQVSRGCNCNCVFCMAPVISGSKIQYRSPSNIIEEISECISQHGINNFYLRADTFNSNPSWVEELCRGIISERLNIKWVTSCKATPMGPDMLLLMKKSGCWMVAVGLESASDETLRKIHKPSTASEGIRAVRNLKKAGILSFGYFIIGFPWETREDILETTAFAVQCDCDFVEFHFPVIYNATPLSSMISREFTELSELENVEYFAGSSIRTKHLDSHELSALRKRALLRVYFSPGFIFKTLKRIRSPREAWNYIKGGVKLLR